MRPANFVAEETMSKIVFALAGLGLLYVLFVHNDGALGQQLAGEISRWLVEDVLKLGQP